MPITRTKAEIDEQLDKAMEGFQQGSRFPGMTFEEGVQYALLWVTGESDDKPMEDE